MQELWKKKIDLDVVLNNVESMFMLGQSWEMYVNDAKGALDQRISHFT